jgi:hypothetical protein
LPRFRSTQELRREQTRAKQAQPHNQGAWFHKRSLRYGRRKGVSKTGFRNASCPNEFVSSPHKALRNNTRRDGGFFHGKDFLDRVKEAGRFLRISRGE